MPVLTLPRALFTLLSLAILAAGAYLLWTWGRGMEVRGPDGVWRHVNGPVWRLYLGAGLLGWSFLGRLPVLALMRRGRDDPPATRREAAILDGPDGMRIAVETGGRADGPVVVLTHGWGLEAAVWAWTRRDLERRYRVVAWDLPGLGRSSPPASGRLTLEGMAEALALVLDRSAERPALLVGHSIGGMVIQTLFRVRPDLARRKVAGVALLNTTYLDPARTMWLAPLWTALQKPLLEPVSWLTVVLSPLVRVANWQSYLSGSAQIAMRLTGFGRFATRRQVDTAALMACRNSPAVQARGNLAMFHWEEGTGLRAIDVPALVVAGSRDIVTRPEASEVIASRAPGARLATVEGAGHMGFMEASGPYGRLLEAFAEQAFLTPRRAAADGDGRVPREPPEQAGPPPVLH